MNKNTENEQKTDGIDTIIPLTSTYDDHMEETSFFMPVTRVAKVLSYDNKSIYYGLDTMCQTSSSIKDIINPFRQTVEKRRKIEEMENRIFAYNGLDSTIFKRLMVLFFWCRNENGDIEFSFSDFISTYKKCPGSETFSGIKIKNSCFIGKDDKDVYDTWDDFYNDINSNTLCNFVKGTEYMKKNRPCTDNYKPGEDIPDYIPEGFYDIVETNLTKGPDYYVLPVWIQRTDKDDDIFKSNIQEYFNLKRECSKYTEKDFIFLDPIIDDIKKGISILQTQDGKKEYFSLVNKKNAFCEAAKKIIEHVKNSSVFRNANNDGLKIEDSNLNEVLMTIQNQLYDEKYDSCTFEVKSTDTENEKQIKEILDFIKFYLAREFNKVFEKSHGISAEISNEIIETAGENIEVYIWQSIIEAIARRYADKSADVRNKIIENYLGLRKYFHESKFEMTEDEKKVSGIEDFIKKVIGDSIELKQDELHELKELALDILRYLAPQFSCTQVFSYEVHNDEIGPEMLILDDKLFVSIKSLLKAFRNKYKELEASSVDNMCKFNGMFNNVNNDDIIENQKKVISVKRANIPVNSVLDIENVNLDDLNNLIENDKTADEEPEWKYAYAINGRSLTIHNYIMDIIIENVKNGKINKVTEFFKGLEGNDVQNEDFKNDCIWYIENFVCKECDFIIEDKSFEELANVLSNKKLYERSDFVRYTLAKIVLKAIDQLSEKIKENVLNNIKKHLKTDKEFQDILSRNPKGLKEFFSSLTQKDIREILDYSFASNFIPLPALTLSRLLCYIVAYAESEKSKAIEDDFLKLSDILFKYIKKEIGGFEYHHFVDFINKYGLYYLLDKDRIGFTKEIMNTKECIKHMSNLTCDRLEDFQDFVSRLKPDEFVYYYDLVSNLVINLLKKKMNFSESYILNEFISNLKLGKKSTDFICSEVEKFNSDEKKYAIDILCGLNNTCFANLKLTDRLSKEDFGEKKRVLENNLKERKERKPKSDNNKLTQKKQYEEL